jgi:protein phosphatase
MPPADSRAFESDSENYLVFDALLSRFYETEPRGRIEVQFGARSHRGLVRPINEDHYLIVRRSRRREVVDTNLPEGLLTATTESAYTISVADGMGGHNHGELASLMALQAGWYFGANEIKWTHKVNEKEREDLRKKSQVFFQMVNRTMQLEGQAEPRLNGMGTTLTIAYSSGPELFVMHAGDSRAYLVQDGELQRLTRDHTVSEKLIESGLAQPGSEEERKRRHILTSSLGTSDEVPEVDFVHVRLGTGNTLLLCTDGLTDMVDDATIGRVLAEAPDADSAAAELETLALKNGGRDNVTVVVARYTMLPARHFLDSDEEETQVIGGVGMSGSGINPGSDG